MFIWLLKPLVLPVDGMNYCSKSDSKLESGVGFLP